MLEKKGWSKEDIVQRRRKQRTKETVKNIIKELKKKEEKRRKKIEELQYNSEYKNIWTQKIPKYLRGKRGKKERNTTARYRCGNEIRRTQVWRGEQERKCRVCGIGEESVRHVLEECEKTKTEMTAEELLREDGRGKEILWKIEKASGKNPGRGKAEDTPKSRKG